MNLTELILYIIRMSSVDIQFKLHTGSVKGVKNVDVKTSMVQLFRIAGGLTGNSSGQNIRLAYAGRELQNKDDTTLEDWGVIVGDTITIFVAPKLKGASRSKRSKKQRRIRNNKTRSRR